MQETSAVIIVAAGTSRRMQGHDKLWMPLAGRITLARTIDVFDASPLINTIILVINAERLTDAKALCKKEGWQKIVAIVPGGARRQDSVSTGLDTLAKIAATTSWVMIHDGARPLVTATILEAGLQAAQQHKAAIAAVPVKDTIKVVAEGKVQTTLERSQLWAVQTPQVFAFSQLHQAHSSLVAQADVTDDAALLEQFGYSVAIFPGTYTNIKITTREDILLAETFLRGQHS
ncbi:MAG: 2-C-methyl-D-erythritol 4-phosphate cytidylyltransferase [Ktedonobacteraceae bacterium]